MLGTYRYIIKAVDKEGRRQQARHEDDGLGKVCAKIGAAGVHIVDQRPGMANNEVREILFGENAAGSVRVSYASQLGTAP